mmetsp:Transcript_21658/g.39449  ORF Transcript_21658/g.39449 Transcript_21658/m.39449 type:complete len:234 (+) Transcript_21658:1871-2572(+)
MERSTSNSRMVSTCALSSRASSGSRPHQLQTQEKERIPTLPAARASASRRQCLGRPGKHIRRRPAATRLASAAVLEVAQKCLRCHHHVAQLPIGPLGRRASVETPPRPPTACEEVATLGLAFRELSAVPPAQSLMRWRQAPRALLAPAPGGPRAPGAPHRQQSRPSALSPRSPRCPPSTDISPRSCALRELGLRATCQAVPPSHQSPFLRCKGELLAAWAEACHLACGTRRIP